MNIESTPAQDAVSQSGLLTELGSLIAACSDDIRLQGILADYLDEKLGLTELAVVLRRPMTTPQKYYGRMYELFYWVDKDVCIIVHMCNQHPYSTDPPGVLVIELMQAMDKSKALHVYTTQEIVLDVDNLVAEFKRCGFTSVHIEHDR